MILGNYLLVKVSNQCQKAQEIASSPGTCFVLIAFTLSIYTISFASSNELRSGTKGWSATSSHTKLHTFILSSSCCWNSKDSSAKISKCRMHNAFFLFVSAKHLPAVSAHLIVIMTMRIIMTIVCSRFRPQSIRRTAGCLYRVLILKWPAAVFQGRAAIFNQSLNILHYNRRHEFL